MGMTTSPLPNPYTDRPKSNMAEKLIAACLIVMLIAGLVLWRQSVNAQHEREIARFRCAHSVGPCTGLDR
jgi:cytochrome b subunit of formate dehydrogenase